MRVLLSVLVAFAWIGAARAAPQCLGLTDVQLLAATIDPQPGAARVIAAGATVSERGQRSTAAGFGLPITIRRPPSVTQGWDKVQFIGAARSVERLPHPASVVRNWLELAVTSLPFNRQPYAESDLHFARAAVRVDVVSRTADEVQVRVLTPERTKRAIVAEDWQLVVAGCSEADTVLLYAAVHTTLYDWGFAVAITLFGMALAWLFLTRAAWKRHAARLQRAWLIHNGGNADDNDDTLRDWAKLKGFPGWGEAPAKQWRDVLANTPDARRIRWKLLRAADPVFISQDGLGDGSLGRLQLLVFSMVVVALLFYVYWRTGVIVGFSQDLLVLLGITGASTALSRLAIARSPVSPQTHALLLRLGVVNVNRNMPSWSGVISSDGEVDVTRVQALAFSVLVIVALVFTGVYDLVNFQLSDQVKWLLGISQGVYIAGKLVPSEACQRLDAEVNEMIKAAREDLDGKPGARERFAASRDGASRTLFEVYGSRADLNRFRNASEAEVA